MLLNKNEVKLRGTKRKFLERITMPRKCERWPKITPTLSDL